MSKNKTLLFILTFFSCRCSFSTDTGSRVSSLPWGFPFKPEISSYLTRFAATCCLWNTSNIRFSLAPPTILCHATYSSNLTKINENENKKQYNWQTCHSLIWTVNQFTRSVRLIQSKTLFGGRLLSPQVPSILVLVLSTLKVWSVESGIKQLRQFDPISWIGTDAGRDMISLKSVLDGRVVPTWHGLHKRTRKL